jgi:hypothetical protein
MLENAKMQVKLGHVLLAAAALDALGRCAMLGA